MSQAGGPPSFLGSGPRLFEAGGPGPGGPGPCGPMEIFRSGPREFFRSGGPRAFLRGRMGKVLIGAAVVVVAIKVYKRYKRQQRRKQWSEAGKDVVVLHQFPRATNMPNLSPFALKLETWLRMANIKYVVDTEEPMGEKRGKCPWITINGEEISDSELIIDFLSKHFNQPIKEQLSAEQHAIGRVVQVMLDEHTVVCVAYKRYVLDRMAHVVNWFPKKYRGFVAVMRVFWMRWLKKYFWMVGMGRFSEPEMMFFLKREVRALADLLGEKQFLLGAAPTSCDAAVFAELTQIIYGCAPEFETYVKETHQNLVNYHNRMKVKFWPDWEQCKSE